MKDIKINYKNNGIVVTEKLRQTKQLTSYGQDLLSFSAKLFYMNSEKGERIRDYLFLNQIKNAKRLILSPDVLLHFSTGYTSVESVKNILKNGLKCYEANGFNKDRKYTGESNYVVDTWQFQNVVPYSFFAKDSPKYMTGLDMDRLDMNKSYTPPYDLKDHTEYFIKQIKESLIFGFSNLDESSKRDIEKRALSNIGFIINKKDIPVEMENLDIYSNQNLQKEFCGDTFIHNSNFKGKYNINMSQNGKNQILGTYGVASYLYGIPKEFIMGIIAPYGLLYSDEMCTELFNSGLNDKCIISPKGTLLYAPNKLLDQNINLSEFLRNKDEFLAEQDMEYRGYILTKDVIQYQESKWQYSTDVQNGENATDM